MRQPISTVAMSGVVVIGEGEKDEAPMLLNGGKVGNDQGSVVDTAVDPVDGMTLMAEGRPNSIAVLAAANRGSIYDPSAVSYMDKIVVGPEAADKIDIEAPVEHDTKVVVKAKGLCPEDVIVVALDRPRHADMICDIREAGAKARLIGDDDVAGAVAVAQNTNSVDIMIGVGGILEGATAACVMKYMGGEIQGKLHPCDEAEIKKAFNAGHDLSRVLATDDLVALDNCYSVVIGVTNGNMLRGVACRGNGAWTRSLVMRSKPNTIRRIETLCSLERLRKYASIDYGKGEMPDIDL